MTLEEQNIKIAKMREIRFVDGIEQIELYEKLNLELREANNINCIPDLCEIMEDTAYNCSAIEGVLETILVLIDKNDTKKAIDKVIEGTPKMEGHANDWAEMLHSQLLRDDSIRDAYIECVKRADKANKSAVLTLLNKIKEKKWVKDLDMEAIISNIC